MEVFTLKNKEDQKNFKEVTNNETYLSEVFDTNDDLNCATDEFINRLNKIIKRTFRKIRITEKPNKEIEELFEKRRLLSNKIDAKSQVELEVVEAKLAEKCAESNYNKIKNEISKIDVDEGGVHSGSLWKLKKKISPRCRDPPTAMRDESGNLVTSQEAIEKLSLETYKQRLKNRAIKDNLKNFQIEKEELCYLRLEKARQNKTTPWTMKQLNVVLKYLKNNKSRDPLGYANEIFHPSVAGRDLKEAILKLVNRIKNEQKPFKTATFRLFTRTKAEETILTITEVFLEFLF